MKSQKLNKYLVFEISLIGFSNTFRDYKSSALSFAVLRNFLWIWERIMMKLLIFLKVLTSQILCLNRISVGHYSSLIKLSTY